MSFSSVRIAAGYSLDDVSREFRAPLDAVQGWEDGSMQPPHHITRSLDLIGRLAEPGADNDASACESPCVEGASPTDALNSSSSPAIQPARMTTDEASRLIKSKQRVADHGEVFTPPWLVEKMLDLVKAESERIDSRFLEPACGSGNFLMPVLQRKLAAVERAYGKSAFDRQHRALQALTCIYGIELLADNIAECRANMLEVFAAYLGLEEGDELYRAASHVLSLNLIHGDAMTMRAADGTPITVVEWGYLGRGKFQRRDFRLDVLTGMAGFREDGSLFARLGRHEVFTPIGALPPMTVRELAAAESRPVTVHTDGHSS
ncbi:N-6 DNA methylase [Phenylobacterium sp.]|uniref:N-6 DNA methylase n=1 Tax=Phenylobacterium sp. TaxID=1871053 RepID=UPI003D26AA66